MKKSLNIDDWAWLRRREEGSGLEIAGPAKEGRDHGEECIVKRPKKSIIKWAGINHVGLKRIRRTPKKLVPCSSLKNRNLTLRFCEIEENEVEEEGDVLAYKSDPVICHAVQAIEYGPFLMDEIDGDGKIGIGECRCSEEAILNLDEREEELSEGVFLLVRRGKRGEI